MQLIGDALSEVVEELKATGINATTEPSKVNLPGALVVPGLISFDILDEDTYSAVIDIYLLTNGNKGSIQSMNELQGLLNKFRTIYQIPEAEPISIQIPNIGGPDPVPGLQVSLQATITKD